MRTTFVALGVFAVLAAAAPAVAGVTGNGALSREIDVKVAPSPSASSSTPSARPPRVRITETPDDKGSLRTSHTAEPGDDKGGLRTSRTAEPGDDHGGHGSDDSGSDDSGSDDSGGDDSGGHRGRGSDDGPGHD